MTKISVETELTKYEIEIEQLPKEETKDECLGVKIIVDDKEHFSGVLRKEPQNPVKA